MRTYAPFSCNPFRIRTYKKQAGGGGASSGSGARHSPFVARRNTQVLSFHTLAHSFALTKNSTLFFSSASALFAKNHPGGRRAPAKPAFLSSSGTPRSNAAQSSVTSFACFNFPPSIEGPDLVGTVNLFRNLLHCLPRQEC